MSLKSSFKLPGAPKEGKVRNITKLPSSNDGSVITNYTQKDVRNTFQKVTFPIFLDFSEGYYQLESDDFMKSCTNVVKELDLSSNSLIEVSSLSHLTKLKRLILNRNNLVDVSLAGLSSLVYLGCCNNRLDHLTDMSDCKKLTNIDLSGNRLVEGFEHLSKLKSLKILDISSNNITFTLADFGKKVMEPIKKIKTLEYLSLENNPIEKKIDEFRLYVINELPKLKYLNWIAITKEERTKAAKLESDGFWVKLQQIQQQQQQQQAPNTPAGRASFVQRKPSFGMSMSPKLSSSLSRSTDVLMGSASASSSSGNNGRDVMPNINASLAAAAEGSTPPLPTPSHPMAIPTTVTNTTTSSEVDSSPRSVPLKGRRLSITGSSDSHFSDIRLNVEETVQPSPTSSKKSPLSDMMDFGHKASSLGSSVESPRHPVPVSASSLLSEGIRSSDLTKEQSESYLDMILDELPPANADFSKFTSVVDQKLFLDLLYRAIVEDSIPDELESICIGSGSTTLSSSSSSSVSPAATVAEPVATIGESPAAASAGVTTTVVHPSNLIVPEEDEEMPPVMSPFQQRLSVAISIEDQDEEVLQVASVVDTMNISTVVPSMTKESSRESLLPTIKLNKSSENTSVVQQPTTTTTTTTTTEQPATPVVKVPSPVVSVKKVPAVRPPPTVTTTKSEMSNPAIEVQAKPFSATKDIWKKISENETTTNTTTTPTTPVKTPIAKPIAKPNPVPLVKPSTNTNTPVNTTSTPIPVPAKPPGKMVIKKVPISKPPATTATGVSTSPVMKPVPSIVTKPSAVTPTVTTPSTHKLENTVPKPVVTLTETGVIDIDHFNSEMEKALADIESSFVTKEQPPVVKVLQQPQIEEDEKVESTPQTLETTTLAINNNTITTTIPTPPPMIEEDEPPKVVEQPHTKPTIPKSLLSNIVKKQESPLEQVESASSALDEMIQAYSNNGKSNNTNTPIVKQQPTQQPTQQQQPVVQLKINNNNNNNNTTPIIINVQPSLLPSGSMSIGLEPWSVAHSSIQVGAKLGMGTFGDCYTAKINHTNPVLIKKLRIQRFSDQFLNQFKNEVAQVRQLTHENLLSVSGCCVDNNIYIINSYPDGGTSSLQQLLDNNQFQMSNEFIHRVSLSISKAMVYLHQHDTIHRALKPSNVIIEHRDGGNVLVRDYAFCFIKDSVFNTGQHGNAYMAPELFNSSCNSYDQLSDQFSFGMLLWQLFARSNPFSDIQNGRIKDYIVSGHRPELSDNIPTVFNRLIRACWNPDASSRPTFLTISKILSQPFQRIFAVSPNTKPAPVVSSSSSIPIPISNNNINNMHASNPTITHQAKHQFSETGQLKKKMNLVLEKITSMLFDSQQDSVKKALKALENLSSPENHQHIIGIGMMSNLVKIASGPHLQSDTKEQILRVLYSLCTNETLSNEFINSGGFVPLNKFINSQESSIVLGSIKLLSVLADEQQLERVRSSGLLEPLLVLIRSDNENIVSQVVGALSRVLLDVENQRFFIENGSVPLLIEMMDSPQNGLSMRALLALCCLITNPACKQQLLDADMISKLMELLASPQKLLRLHTLKIVQNISKDKEFRNLMVQSSCIEILVAQMESYTTSVGNHSNNEILCLIFESLGSLLKNQSDISIFYECQGVNHLVKFVTYNQTDDILNGVLSITYSLIHHEQSRNILRQIIPRLVEILSKSTISTHIITQILYVLTLFSNHTSSLEALDSTMIISVISTLLIANSNNHEVKLNSLKFISGIAKLNAAKLSVTQMLSVLQILVDYLSDKSVAIKEEAIATISWLSANNECRSVLLQKGVLKTLINYKSLNNDCNERLLWAISFFAFDEVAQAIMRENVKVFQFITENLEKDQEVFKTLAIKSTLILVQKPENKQHLLNAGISFPLQILQQSQSRSIALASKKILSLLEQ